MSDFETSTDSDFAKDARLLLGKTAPWITFLAVMSFIGASFMVLACLGLLISPRISNAGGLGIAGGFVYLFGAAMGFLSGAWAIRLSRSTRELAETANELRLTAFATIFRRIVLFFGISTIVAVSLMIIGIIALVTLGVSSGVYGFGR